jgi:hypothetical protein
VVVPSAILSIAQLICPTKAARLAARSAGYELPRLAITVSDVTANDN